MSDLGTPKQVAERLHTTPQKLANDRYMGRGISYVRNGRRILYRWADVDAYLEANRHIHPGAA